jgi:hypothetical protein
MSNLKPAQMRTLATVKVATMFLWPDHAIGKREQHNASIQALLDERRELLEALDGFLSWSIENEERPNYATKVQKPVVVEKVRAAIAKARGVANI